MAKKQKRDLVEYAIGVAEELAKKLGTTAEQVWPVLVRQVYIEALSESVGWSVGLLAFIPLFVLRAHYVPQMDSDNASFTLVLLIVLSVTAVVIFGGYFSTNILPVFLNPTYYAMLRAKRLLGKD